MTGASESLADRFREKVRAKFAGELGSTDTTVNDDLVALCFAKDLMQGDPTKHKAGYTAANAALAARKVFPEADQAKLEAGLGLSEPDEPKTPCHVCGVSPCHSWDHQGNFCCGDDGACAGRVIVIENRVGDWEGGPLIDEPIILTADHIELTVEVLIEHAREKYSVDAILVIDATGWKSADDWLRDKRLGSAGGQ